MRAWWWLPGALLACSTSQPVGSYRLPFPTSPTSVELVTVLARTNGDQLILFNTATDSVFATGTGNLSAWDTTVPYDFTVPAGDPMQLITADGVLQDAATRPYKTMGIPALDPSATSVTRVTLTSGTDQRVIVSSGDNLFEETAETQPSLSETPGPLFALGSVAGVGLTLPPNFDIPTQWSDAMSTYVPPSPTQALPCGAPLVAAIRSTGPVSVTVPAGQFQAIHVTEIITTCQQPNPPNLLVYEIDRWYAPGVGPVQMTYEDSNALTHTYELVAWQVSSGGTNDWPLAVGNSWTYEVLDPTGTAVSAPVTVAVSNVDVVSQH
jgi:hypothetical protein